MTDPQETGSEQFEWCVFEEGGTVTIAVETSDDEGLRQHDREKVEVEIPDRGVLRLSVDGEGVDLDPNTVDGPRVRSRGGGRDV